MKRPEPWAPVARRYWHHPKIIQLSLSAAVAYQESFLWSADNGTDGWLPERAVSAVMLAARTPPKRRRSVVKELTDSGMWSKVEGGYLIHDFLHWQRTKAEVEEDRRQAAERQRRHRRGGELE